MTIAVGQVNSDIFRGGGSHKKPIYLSVPEMFGDDKFTFRQASAKIPGYTRSVNRDLLAAGLIENVTNTYPYYYRVHQPSPTHKLTRKEIIKRLTKGTGSHGVARYD